MNWTAPEVMRSDWPTTVGEREMLENWLDFERSTLLLKCAGLTPDQLAHRGVPPSSLSLLGLLRHATDAERIWFRIGFRGDDMPQEYFRPDAPDAAFDEATPGSAQLDYTRLIDEWTLSRLAVKEASLDDSFTRDDVGTISLRWIYLHMIEEYARHCGHADLLREAVDGVTGY
jgi:hypothetical protein